MTREVFPARTGSDAAADSRLTIQSVDSKDDRKGAVFDRGDLHSDMVLPGPTNVQIQPARSAAVSAGLATFVSGLGQGLVPDVAGDDGGAAAKLLAALTTTAVIQGIGTFDKPIEIALEPDPRHLFLDFLAHDTTADHFKLELGIAVHNPQARFLARRAAPPEEGSRQHKQTESQGRTHDRGDTFKEG